jgi:hypothetical protein
MSDEQVTTTPNSRPGIRTSEHAVTWAASALAGGYGLMSEHSIVQAVSVAAIGFMIGCYSLSRGNKKAGSA